MLPTLLRLAEDCRWQHVENIVADRRAERPGVTHRRSIRVADARKHVPGVVLEDLPLPPLLNGGGRTVRHIVGQPLVEVPRFALAEEPELVQEVPGEQAGTGPQFEYRDPSAAGPRFQAARKQQRGCIRRNPAIVGHDVGHIAVDEREGALACPVQAGELPFQALGHRLVLFDELAPDTGAPQRFGGPNGFAGQMDAFEHRGQWQRDSIGGHRCTVYLFHSNAIRVSSRWRTKLIYFCPELVNAKTGGPICRLLPP